MIAETTTAVIHDAAVAVRLVYKASGPSLLRAWLFVPVGILLMLLACFAADVILRLAGSPFPASVAVLIILFALLLLSEWIFGSNRTRRVVALIDIPGGWSLRWINIFFTPTFVLLPLSPPTGIIEVMKIIAVFVIGFAVGMVLTAYMTRGLQLAVGAPKRAHVHRADELREETQDEIPITETRRSEGTRSPPPSTPPSGTSTPVALGELAAPARSQAPRSIRSQIDEPQAHLPTPPPEGPGNTSTLQMQAQISPAPLPPARSQKWATLISSHLVSIIYTSILLLVGIPIFYAIDYAMPLHLSTTILSYVAAMSLPARWRQYLHPVLVSSLLTVLAIWVLGLTHGHSLTTTLTTYRTGLKYLQLWRGASTITSTSGPLLPGAGDMFGTALDASIVALALPMYQSRRELREHFVVIAVPNVAISVATLFLYPYVCRAAVGISAERSLAFAARSQTLALAVPAVENLGGDVRTVAALAIMSGIVGAVWGPWMLGVMGIAEDDYVTRGVTLGVNSSAIGTALLLRTDPRAGALSSLSMGLFGTVTVLFTSIPPIVTAVRSLVGY